MADHQRFARALFEQGHSNSYGLSSSFYHAHLTLEATVGIGSADIKLVEATKNMRFSKKKTEFGEVGPALTGWLK